jgi:hypothetical protein
MEKGIEARMNNDYEKALDFFNKSLEIKEHPVVYEQGWNISNT